MSKNDYGNRYPGSGTVAPGFSNSKPDAPRPEVPERTSDQIRDDYRSDLAPYINYK